MVMLSPPIQALKEKHLRGEKKSVLHILMYKYENHV